MNYEMVPRAVRQRERALAVLVRGLAAEYETYLDDAVTRECHYRWKANQLNVLANALSPETADDLDDVVETLESNACDLDDDEEPPPSLEDDLPF